jgi:hypothetical protein
MTWCSAPPATVAGPWVHSPAVRAPMTASLPEEAPLAAWRMSMLRRLRPEPFGLEQGSEPALPVMLGQEAGRGGFGVGALRRCGRTLDRMSLLFGSPFDPAAPLLEITTRWDGCRWGDGLGPSAPSGAWELVMADRRDREGGWKDPHLLPPPPAPAAGEFGRSRLGIIVCGAARTVPVVSYRHFQAYSFDAAAVTVTVIVRHAPPGTPIFSPVTDLEPFIAGWLAELGRRWPGQDG